MGENDIIEIEFKEKKKVEEILNILYENPPTHIYYTVDQNGKCEIKKIKRLKQVLSSV